MRESMVDNNIKNTTFKRLYDVPPETEFYVRNGDWYGCVYLGDNGQKMYHIFDGQGGKDMVLTPEDNRLDFDILDKKLRSFRYTAWVLKRNGYEKLDEFDYKKTLEDGTVFFAYLPGRSVGMRCHLSCSDGINELEKTSVVVDNLKAAEDMLLKAVRFLGEEEEHER